MDRFNSESAHRDPGAQASVVAGHGALKAHWHERLDEVPFDQWDELVAGIDGGTPFLRMALLRAMVDSGSACLDTGWRPYFLALRDEAGRLVGACPAFIKYHSYGEYVFDWSWADAHDRALAKQGQRYHPKLLSAVPFSPIPGQRLLVHPALSPSQRKAVRARLLGEMAAECEAKGWSSAHLLFVSEEEAAQAVGQAGPRPWVRRQGVQFHWLNNCGTETDAKPPSAKPFASFEDFLASLHRDKRKKIQQERRKVREAGVRFEVREGTRITEEDWDFFERCYAQTYLERGQQPYLTRAFWRQVSQALPDCWVLFIAERDGERIASALLALDPVQRVAYGRYWGALRNVSCLHFEACYYQPLAWCIEHGIRRFEGGAQGEHKLTRGLLPVATHSVHWLQHDGLRHAVADFLMRETHGMGQYIRELDERSPFKPGDSAT